MDTHMPVMDGLAATRAIRALEAAESRAPTPIISLTADALPQHIRAALAAGADLHLAKPITGAALFAAIEDARRRIHGGRGLEAAS
jgi:CheY-like chemotaxis protein